MDNQEAIRKQTEQWHKDADRAKDLKEFLDSKVYNDIFKEDFYKNYIVDAMEQYITTKDQKYILKACIPIYAKQYMQYINSLGSTATEELRNYYRTPQNKGD